MNNIFGRRDFIKAIGMGAASLVMSGWEPGKNGK